MYEAHFNKSPFETHLNPKVISELIKTTDFVDFYGWEKNDSNLKGGLNKKKDGLVDYKFSICIENANEKNWISEKFFDCVLTNTIPIYFGCSNIKEFFPEEGYFLLNNITNIDEVKNLLKNIDENSDYLYDQMLPNLLKIKEKYFKEFNILKKINNL